MQTITSTQSWWFYEEKQIITLDDSSDYSYGVFDEATTENAIKLKEATDRQSCKKNQF